MTPKQFRTARAQLELSAAKLARVVGLSDGRVIRYYEAGRPIPEPVALLLELILSLPSGKRQAYIDSRLD